MGCGEGVKRLNGFGFLGYIKCAKTLNQNRYLNLEDGQIVAWMSGADDVILAPSEFNEVTFVKGPYSEGQRKKVLMSYSFKDAEGNPGELVLVYDEFLDSTHTQRAAISGGTNRAARLNKFFALINSDIRLS